MTTRRVVGLIVVIVGIAVLAFGGVFWTDRDKVVDVGSLEITTAQREGFALPPVVGGVAIVAGLLLLFSPSRRRA